MPLNAKHLEELVEQSQFAIQYPLPDERHRDGRADDGDNVDDTNQTNAGQARIDQQHQAQPRRYPQDHRADRIDRRIAQRGVSKLILQKLTVIVEASPFRAVSKS